jgi:hypothetical protein
MSSRTIHTFVQDRIHLTQPIHPRQVGVAFGNLATPEDESREVPSHGRALRVAVPGSIPRVIHSHAGSGGRGYGQLQVQDQVVS